ncbi:MAG: FecR domain-containing protein [Pseudomonadota bacterium]
MTTPHRSLAETAFYWRTLMSADAPSQADREAFEIWINADPEHLEAFEYAEKFWAGLGSLQEVPREDFAVDPVPTRLSVFLRPAAQFSSYWPRMALISSFIVLLAVWIGNQNDFLDEPMPQSYTTALGEVAEINLEDGSLVVLGADTTINVAFDENRRVVSLTEGSAYFDVVKATRPFEVRNGAVVTRVTGTRFSVQKRDGLSLIDVAEGSVIVNVPSPNGTREQRLREGERFKVSAREAGELKTIAIDDVGAWRFHRLIYEESPLSSLVADINRYRAKPVVVLDSGLAARRITATFDARQSDLLLDTVTQLFDVELIERPRRTLLVEKRR